MNNSIIELKNDIYDAWVEAELIDVTINEFEIRYSSNNK